MSNYVQSTNFATKDALPSGDPLKIVKGTEINTEFNNIAVAVATKADLISPTFTGTVTAPTALPGSDSTQIATTEFTNDAISTYTDRFRSLFAGATSGTLTISARGSRSPITAGGSIPASVFSANDVVTIFNNTTGALTIAQGAGLTLYLVGTATTGSRTISQRGLATIVFIRATVAVISGGGLG